MPKRELRRTNMIATTTSSALFASSTLAVSSATAITKRRRRIDPRAGRALEKLGHAIEYLTDEFVHDGASFSAVREQLEAVQLLMALNRQVYFECPEVPSFGERWRAFFGLRQA
jgi:hypothetical protein